MVLKTKYDIDKSDLEKKISDGDKKVPDAIELVRKTDYNAKITEIEYKIPSIWDLATTSALTVVENKIPDVSNLVKKKKRNYGTEILDIKSKYFTTTDYNRFINKKGWFKKKVARVVNLKLVFTD